MSRLLAVDRTRSFTSATPVDEITSADFGVPTTVTAFGERLYLPNARFTTTPVPDTAYWVTAVAR